MPAGGDSRCPNNVKDAKADPPDFSDLSIAVRNDKTLRLLQAKGFYTEGYHHNCVDPKARGQVSVTGKRCLVNHFGECYCQTTESAQADAQSLFEKVLRAEAVPDSENKTKAHMHEPLDDALRPLSDYESDVQTPPSENIVPAAAELKQAFDAVRKQYEGSAQWMKAPNGKPTKLNERQWLQVRTQQFKEWFGDWVSAAYRLFLDGDTVATLSGDEFASDGVGEVLLDEKAVKNSLSHGIGRDKAAAFAAVPDVVRNGRIVQLEDMVGSLSGGKAIHMAAPVLINGRRMVMDALVRSDKNISRLYVHEVALIEDLQQSAFKTSAVAASSAGKRTGAAAGAIRNVLQNIYAVNPDFVSKVVDENGEPLVVYYGTDADFSVFDLSHARQNADIPAFFFF